MATQKLLHTFSSLFILSLLSLFETSLSSPYCPPSACGIIRNISYPFRLKDDPKHCGDRKTELTCEKNVTFIYSNSHKFYVKDIQYGEIVATIRVADASINNNTCSFPNSSVHAYDFFTGENLYADGSLPMSLIGCPYPLKNSASFTQNFIRCDTSYYNSSYPNPRYSYIKVGHVKASEVPEMCRLSVVVTTSWIYKDLSKVSLLEIHNSLLYGVEIEICSRGCSFSWTPWERFRNWMAAIGNLALWYLAIILVIIGAIFAWGFPPLVAFTAVSLLVFASAHYFYFNYYYRYLFHEMDFPQLLIASILGPRLVLFPIAFWFLIYKFRRRRLSMYKNIENFLQNDYNLVPIRYSYSEIKKMTRSFKDKLGEGGYGSVYKGKLRSGCDVAIKLLRQSGTDDRDFINEISTIGRIHHVNVVKLVGYCVQGSKRALVLDFMPNGSLEKYLYNREKMNSLNLVKKREVAVGVARGIEYLHRGCHVQILHFDIKPHNILLDDKFIPKIADFGLAKFYSTDKHAITMTAARGTIGYVAPELISRSIGAVSYKADVYSFGMLLMEMAGLKKDFNGNIGDSSLYFPYWIYDHFNQGKDIEIENNDDSDDRTRGLVRKMITVALWCIQMSPKDRPSMNKVLEMLESDVDRLQIPNCRQNVVNVDESGSTYSADSSPLQSCDDGVPFLDITVLE